MNALTSIKTFALKHKITTVIVVLIVGAIVYNTTKTTPPQYETALAERTDLRAEVNITGHVEPAQNIDLAFERSGRISNVAVDIGDHVSRGMVLAQVDNADVYAQLAQAEATLKARQAALDKLLAGTREEELAVYEVKVTNAQTALEDAQKNLLTKITDAYTKADNAIRNQSDQFFSNPRSSSPTFNFVISDGQVTQDLENNRFVIEALLISWQKNIQSLAADSPTLADIGGTTENNLRTVGDFLRELAFAINQLQPSSTLSATTIDGYRTAVESARTNVDTATSNIVTAQEKLRTADSSLKLAKKELVLQQAGSTVESINEQQALVDEATAQVSAIHADLEKTLIRAPFSGVITRRDLDPGEIVTAGTLTLSMISDKKYQIKAFIPEVDIAHVVVGNSASVTLDSYGPDVVFDATVTKIDPAETVIEGVPTYKTILEFKTPDSRIRSGMTANTDILTDSRSNVVAVPSRSVIDDNGDKYIRILADDGTVTRSPVQTGLVSFDGKTEIISGVTEGQTVILFEK